jgi:hypothetical protein
LIPEAAYHSTQDVGVTLDDLGSLERPTRQLRRNQPRVDHPAITVGGDQDRRPVGVGQLRLDLGDPLVAAPGEVLESDRRRDRGRATGQLDHQVESVGDQRAPLHSSRDLKALVEVRREARQRQVSARIEDLLALLHRPGRHPLLGKLVQHLSGVRANVERVAECARLGVRIDDVDRLGEVAEVLGGLPRG